MSEDKKSKKLLILSPLTGKVMPLEDVPDPVFSQKIIGDGVAVFPSEGRIVSPVDGQVVSVADTGHAYGLKTEDGLEILIHVGLNTVEQQGAGFRALVKTGDKVKAGQPLISFDQAELGTCGCDLTTPMVITNGDKVAKMEKAQVGPVQAGKDTVLTITLS